MQRTAKTEIEANYEGAEGLNHHQGLLNAKLEHDVDGYQCEINVNVEYEDEEVKQQGLSNVKLDPGDDGCQSAIKVKIEIEGDHEYFDYQQLPNGSCSNTSSKVKDEIRQPSEEDSDSDNCGFSANSRKRRRSPQDLKKERRNEIIGAVVDDILRVANSCNDDEDLQQKINENRIIGIVEDVFHMSTPWPNGYCVVQNNMEETIQKEIDASYRRIAPRMERGVLLIGQFPERRGIPVRVPVPEDWYRPKPKGWSRSNLKRERRMNQIVSNVAFPPEKRVAIIVDHVAQNGVPAETQPKTTDETDPSLQLQQNVQVSNSVLQLLKVNKRDQDDNDCLNAIRVEVEDEY